MKFIPITVVWREGSKNYEETGAVYAADVGLILPTSRPGEVTMYATLCPDGVTIKGSVVDYVSLIEAALQDDQEIEYELEDEESEGLGD